MTLVHASPQVRPTAYLVLAVSVRRAIGCKLRDPIRVQLIARSVVSLRVIRMSRRQ